MTAPDAAANAAAKGGLLRLHARDSVNKNPRMPAPSPLFLPNREAALVAILARVVDNAGCPAPARCRTRRGQSTLILNLR